MRVTIHPNLTVSHILHARYAHHPLDGIGPKSVLGLPMSVPVEQVVRLDRPAPADNASGEVACRCYGQTDPACAVDTEVDRKEETSLWVMAAPKEVVLIAHGGVGNMLDLFA